MRIATFEMGRWVAGAVAENKGEKNVSGRRKQAGFSLIELLVTLAVMTILMVAIPVASGFLPEIRINKAARTLAQDIRQARALAIKNGKDVIVTFDYTNDQIAIYSDANLDGIEIGDLVRQKSLSDYGDRVDFRAVTTYGVDGQTVSAPVQMGSTSAPIAVTFRPNGIARNFGVIYLAPADNSNAQLGRAIQIFATGKVKTWRYDGDTPTTPWEAWL